MLLTGANISMFVEREGQRPQSQMLTEAMVVFEIGLDPSLKKKKWWVPQACQRMRSQGNLYLSYQKS